MTVWQEYKRTIILHLICHHKGFSASKTDLEMDYFLFNKTTTRLLWIHLGTKLCIFQVMFYIHYMLHLTCRVGLDQTLLEWFHLIISLFILLNCRDPVFQYDQAPCGSGENLGGRPSALTSWVERERERVAPLMQSVWCRPLHLCYAPHIVEGKKWVRTMRQRWDTFCVRPTTKSRQRERTTFQELGYLPYKWGQAVCTAKQAQ